MESSSPIIGFSSFLAGCLNSHMLASILSFTFASSSHFRWLYVGLAAWIRLRICWFSLVMRCNSRFFRSLFLGLEYLMQLFVQSISPLNCSLGRESGGEKMNRALSIVRGGLMKVALSVELLNSIIYTHSHYMRHFLEKDSILRLDLFESFLHKSVLLRLCL